jgi:uncharacterized membrane protein YphA (DoxX/SURF4 family)
MTNHIKKHYLRLVFYVSLFVAPFVVSAHEAYVLNKDFFWGELKKPFNLETLNVFKNPGDVQMMIIIISGTFVALGLNFLFRKTEIGQRLNSGLEKYSSFGPLFIRATIAAAFFYSAYSWSFLGPELSLHLLPFADVLRILLFVCSFCIAIGFLTEYVATISLVIFCIGYFVFGSYVTTYLNYLGEIIVLVLFGMRKWSIDGLLFGVSNRFSSIKKYETTIVRVFYGAALIFAAITVKFLHPALTIQVVNQWNLTQFHWLFPHDPLLVTLGAGLAESAIGLFIMIGFEMRMTVLISLFYITLSLFYFRELVWSHLMLYGISFNLLLQPEIFTLDHVLFEKNKLKLLKKPFLPHI